MKSAESSETNWFVCNQTQTPEFQKLLERLSLELGPCVLFTGTPHHVQGGYLSTRRGTAYNRSTLISRALTWGRFTLEATWRAFTLRGDTFMFVVTNPPTLPEVAWLIHKVRGVPYGLLVYDIYPDHVVRSGLARKGGLIDRLWTTLNRNAMLEARAVITLGDRMAETLKTQLGEQASRVQIEVIPNWADVEWLKPLPKVDNPFAQQHDEVDRVTVIYSGNMGSSHDLDVLVEAARRLQNQTHISFLLIGDGAGRSLIEAKIRDNGLSNVRLLPYQSWDMLPYSLASGDIAFVTQAAASEALSVPSKTYSVMAAGCAVIACTGSSSDLADMIQRHGIGVVCAPGDVEGLAGTIAELANNRELLAEYRARARSTAVDLYSFQSIYERYLGVLRPAVSGSTPD